MKNLYVDLMHETLGDRDLEALEDGKHLLFAVENVSFYPSDSQMKEAERHGIVLEEIFQRRVPFDMWRRLEAEGSFSLFLKEEDLTGNLMIDSLKNGRCGGNPYSPFTMHFYETIWRIEDNHFHEEDWQFTTKQRPDKSSWKVVCFPNRITVEDGQMPSKRRITSLRERY